MSRDPKLRFADIIEGCSAIDVYILGYSFDDFQRDPKTRDAVVRQMEIIGEAVKSIPDALRKKQSQIPWRNIAGFRDMLIHSYFGIDDSVVWDAAVAHLPKLRQACELLLSELEP